VTGTVLANQRATSFLMLTDPSATIWPASIFFWRNVSCGGWGVFFLVLFIKRIFEYSHLVIRTQTHPHPHQLNYNFEKIKFRFRIRPAALHANARTAQINSFATTTI
jgi:hypothetical protein